MPVWGQYPSVHSGPDSTAVTMRGYPRSGAAVLPQESEESGWWPFGGADEAGQRKSHAADLQRSDEVHALRQELDTQNQSLAALREQIGSQAKAFTDKLEAARQDLHRSMNELSKQKDTDIENRFNAQAQQMAQQMQLIARESKTVTGPAPLSTQPFSTGAADLGKQAFLDNLHEEIKAQRSFLATVHEQMPNILQDIKSQRSFLTNVHEQVPMMIQEIRVLKEQMQSLGLADADSTSKLGKAVGKWFGYGGGSNSGIDVKQMRVMLQDAFVEENNAIRAHVEETVSKERSLLRADTAQQLLEFHSTVAGIRTEIELSSIKAGYLAVAASECEHEEKARIFARLQEKEKVLVHGQVSNTVRGTKATQAFRKAPPETVDIVVDISRKPGLPLGLSIDGSDGEGLYIEEVIAGLVQQWNIAKSNDATVRAGDKITSVNGINDNSRKMTKLLEDTTVQNLRLIVRQDNSRSCP